MERSGSANVQLNSSAGLKRVCRQEDELCCPFPNLPTGVLEMRVKEGSKIRNLMGFSMARMQDGAALRQVVFSGSGRAVTKTITCAEIMKRKMPGLHQISRLQYRGLREVWESREGGDAQVTVHRTLPSISILLSKDPLDPLEPGYQPPEDPQDLLEPGYQPLKDPKNPVEPEYQPLKDPKDPLEPAYQLLKDHQDLQVPGYQPRKDPKDPLEPGYQLIKDPKDSLEPRYQLLKDPKRLLNPGYQPLKKDPLEPGYQPLKYPKDPLEPRYQLIKDPKELLEPRYQPLKDPQGLLEPGYQRPHMVEKKRSGEPSADCLLEPQVKRVCV